MSTVARERNQLMGHHQSLQNQEQGGGGTSQPSSSLAVGRSVCRKSRKGHMRGKGGPENAQCSYKGVRQRTWGKWVAEIREPNNGARLWLGTFNTSHEAASAYDTASCRLYGATANLNFPKEKEHAHPLSSGDDDHHPFKYKYSRFPVGLWESQNPSSPELEDTIWAETTLTLGLPPFLDSNKGSSMWDFDASYLEL